ncbi:MAG: hypothetical protein AB7L13_10985 [Acidimicrobiia bacterium]
MSEPQLRFVRTDDVPQMEVLAQNHGDTYVGARLRFLERGRYTVNICDYDPGLTVERHGHSSDHLLYVLEGDLMVGDTHCPTGTLIMLDHGAEFGPLVAGPNGARLFEHYSGEVTPVPSPDQSAFHAHLESNGITELPRPYLNAKGENTLAQ